MRKFWIPLQEISLFLALLLVPVLAAAQTWPRDVTGTPAAECAALDASGTPQLCGPLNPLPVVSSGALGGSAGPTVGSQNWFLSQPPGYQPFVRLDGTASNRSVVCPAFLDDVNLICFQGSNVGSNLVTFRSFNAGQSFQAVSQSASLGANIDIQSVVRLPSGSFLLSTGGATATVSFVITPDGLGFTTSTCTGCGTALAGGSSQSLTLNGSTILGTAFEGGGLPAGQFSLCRSTNTGATFTCTTGIPISGYTGAGQAAWDSGNAMIAAPSAGVWLGVVVRSGGDQAFKIIRSTNDGVSWSEVFNDATIANPVRGIACLTSTLCLAVARDRIHRSTNAGLTWTTIVTSGPDGANTGWNSIAVFDSLTAVAIPFNGAGTPGPPFYRTVDGGLTWLTVRGAPSACPANSGVANQANAVVTRNGRALVISEYTSLTANNAPCAFYATSGSGGTSVVGPLGTAWNIGADGSGPISQGNPLTPFTVAPVQGPTLFNSQTTGAANTAVVVTIAAVAVQRAHVYRIEASCSAGTSSLTITDLGVTVWSTLAAEVTTTRFRQAFTPAALTGGTNAAVVVTLATCGVGNLGTLIVHADRY